MPAHRPMSLRLQTQRLTMTPWAESDVDDYRALEELGFQRHHVTWDDMRQPVWLTRTLP